LHDLSLRRMAATIGVTHATLLRHFASKEALVAEALEHLRQTTLDELELDRELRDAPSGADQLRILWERWRDPRERRQFLLLTDTYTLAVRDPQTFGGLLEPVVRDWLPLIAHGLRRDGWDETQIETVATVLLAQIRGLQLDLTATGERDRVDRAFDFLLSTLTNARPPGAGPDPHHDAP
jgi:AcrR family transcriptional regulator